MKRTLVASASVASASLALACALAAHAVEDDIDTSLSGDFAASKGASAEEQLRQRLRAKIRTIAGTDTQYLIGGYLQLDGLATRRTQDGDEQNTFLVASTPFGPADHDYRSSVRQSQFNWLSRTPTGIGPVWSRLEANLFPLDGRTAPTLNQLFVRFDDRVTVGKTYSTFMDDAALPTTLDYNGPGGLIFARQLLVRGKLEPWKGWALEGSVEDPQAQIGVGGPILSAASSADRPDLAMRVRYEGERGHVQLAALSRRVSVTATSPVGTAERRVDGSGVSVSGALPAFKDDTLLLQIATGKGIGRYFNDPLSSTGVGVNDSGRLELLRITGATLYYRRTWAPGWMTVAGASSLRFDGNAPNAPDALRRIVYASANLIHHLRPTIIVGAEVLWGRAAQVDGTDATNLRLQLSLRYLIF